MFMYIKDIYEMFGNISIPDSFLKSQGIIEEDRMLSAEEVKQKLGFSDIAQAYKVIKKLKYLNNLKYTEAKIAKSLVDDYYGLKK